MKQITTYAIRPVGTALVILFAAALIWCGDVDCWSELSDDQCASLVCSLFANHAGSGQEDHGNDSTDCTCVCHLPTIPVLAFGVEYHPPVFNSTEDIVVTVPLSPVRSIYHPPLAA